MMLQVTAILCALVLTPPPVPGGAPFKPPVTPRKTPGTPANTPPLGPGGKAQPAPPPPPAAPPSQPAGPAPAGPSAEQQESQPVAATVPDSDLVLLDTKPLIPKLDAMHDVQPLSGVIGRCPAVVAVAAPALPDQSAFLSWQTEADQVKLVARNPAGQNSTVGVLRWKGASLEWAWVRCSQTSFPQAVADAERMLRWMTIRITLDSGRQMLGTVAAQRVVRTVPPFGTTAVMSTPPVRGLVLVAEPSTVWTVTPATGGRTLQLDCPAGSFSMEVDSQQRRVSASFQSGNGSVTVGELRQLLSERTKELQRATPDEKLLIEAEIQKIKADLAAAEAEARKRAPWPSPPIMRVQDELGRVVAVLELQVKGS